MPTYVFNCKKCNITEEEIFSITSKANHKCTKCKGKTQKVLQPSNFALSGNDWPSRDMKRIAK